MQKVDRVFLGITGALVLFGFIIFSSASVGLLAREGASTGGVAVRQLIAAVMGLTLAYLVSRVDHKLLRRFSLPIFILSVILTALVFIPSLGVSYGGAKRWLLLGPLTIQPSEFLKLGSVIYAAAFFSAFKDKMSTIKFGLISTAVIIGICGLLLLSQPDTDTFIVIALAISGMYLAGGGRLKHFGILVLAGILGLSLLISSRPYLKDRIMTFIDPSADPLDSGYQIQQSMIAIGSGGFFGRGFGQGIQKFNYLPEPIGDSIFAVAGEEFGFLGSVILIGLFTAFVLRGLKISAGAGDSFGRLVCLGVVILIGAGAFINMASLLSLIPFSGLPLSFVSHGGTALIFSLVGAGIILNISRRQKLET